MECVDSEKGQRLYSGPIQGNFRRHNQRTLSEKWLDWEGLSVIDFGCNMK